MEHLKYYYAVIDALSNGKVIRTSVAVFLKVLGIVLFLGVAYVCVDVLKISFRLPTTPETIGGLLLTFLLIVAGYSTAQVFFYRANSVNQLSDGPFTIIPIVSILYKMVGEICATWLIALGLGGAIVLWIGGISPGAFLGEFGYLLPRISAEWTFAGGFLLLLYSSSLAFAVLVLAYLLSESTIVVVDIAMNLRHLRKSEDEKEKEYLASATQFDPARLSKKCPNCSEQIKLEARICRYCGRQFTENEVSALVAAMKKYFEGFSA